MSDDRASRLRSRRGRARQRAEEREAGEASESAAATETVDTDDSPEQASDGSTDHDDTDDSMAADAATADEAERGSVKVERVGTYMYLPESQKRELERVYGTLKVQYEYEFDEEFEKNRHFFPAVVRHGLEALDGMDATEIRDIVDEL